MIGQVDSYQSIYVALCGQQFTNRLLAADHEKQCPSCETIAKEIGGSDEEQVTNADVGRLTADVVRLTREAAERNMMLARFRELAVEADSELSAIAHGRPPSSKDNLTRLALSFREIYSQLKP